MNQQSQKVTQHCFIVTLIKHRKGKNIETEREKKKGERVFDCKNFYLGIIWIEESKGEEGH